MQAPKHIMSTTKIKNSENTLPKLFNKYLHYYNSLNDPIKRKKNSKHIL